MSCERTLFVLSFVFLCSPLQAQTRELHPVPVTNDHDPLYVDPATISRSGSRVSFKYVLDVPAALQGGDPRRWRSNEMTGVLDCAAKSYSLSYIEAYAGPAATGNVVGRYSPTPAERKPAPVVPGGTLAHLAGHLCPR